MKKRILGLVLAGAMCVSLVACGSSSTDSEELEEAVDDAVEELTSDFVEEEIEEAEESAEAEATTELETVTDGVLTFGTNAEFPPFEYVAAEGVIDEFDGIDMVIAKQIAEDNGLEAAISNMEFDSLLVALQNGQIDAVIAGMTATEERAEAVDFSTTYYTATQVMIVKEDSDIASAADLEGKYIAVVQGYTGETCVQDLGYTTDEYEALKKGTECITELVNGKCDVVVIDSATAEKYVSDNEGLKIVEDEEAFGSEEYAVAVAKGNEAMLTAINATIDSMLADGSISDIAVEYTESLTEE